MLTIVICDDNDEHASYAEQLIKKSLPADQVYTITKYNRAQDLLNTIMLEKLHPDIAVLDISMPEMDGMTLADRLHEMLPTCKIIFLTSFAKYASAVYRHNHIWFITKNSASEYMSEALLKAIEELKYLSPDLLMLHTRGNTKFIPVDDVLYLERNRHSTLVATKGTKYIVSTHPDILIESCSSLFIRCHQSFWVNIKAIKELDKNTFLLVDDTVINISRSFRNTARSRFFEQKIL